MNAHLYSGDPEIFMDKFSIFLIDPNRLMREGIKRILTQEAYTIAGEAGSIEEARNALGSAGDADLVIFDTKDWDGEAIASFVEEVRSRGMKAAVLTSDCSHSIIAKALSWSLDAYLLKDMTPEALSRSLHLVILGQRVFPISLMADLVSASNREPATRSSREPVTESGTVKGLTPREVEILRCLSKGYQNKVIAQALNIGDGTVKTHLRTLMRKMRVSNRTEAVIWAMNNGLSAG
jgi:two-component system, NarL family, nitrate/nitrite response regulator NarL